MTDHVRTRIKTLSVRGYRSLRQVELRDIPELVVLHGPNGSGKTSIVLAIRLVLRAALHAGSHGAAGLATSRDRPCVLSLATADEALDLRPDDFSRGQPAEMRIAMEVLLGSRAREVILPGAVPASSLFLELVVQGAADETRDKTLRYWFERADVDDRVGLSVRGPMPLQHVSMALAEVVDLRDRLARELASRHDAAPGPLVAMRSAVEGAESRVNALEARAAAEQAVAGRIEKLLLPKLVHTAGAYRVPGGREDPTLALYHAFLSEDPRQQAAARAVSATLGKVGLFGPPVGPFGGDKRAPIELTPVEAKTYGEEQVRFTHPVHGSLPLRNLGQGEQQLFFLVAQLALTSSPIVLLEHPEAHLHLSFAESVGAALRKLVDDGTVDQLWVASRQFGGLLKVQCTEVTLADGWTTVQAVRP